jgi:hypothetical protein
VDIKSRWVWQLKCYKIFSKIFQRANLSTFENQKIAPHCRFASGVWGPLFCAANSLKRAILVVWQTRKFKNVTQYKTGFASSQTATSAWKRDLYHVSLDVLFASSKINTSGNKAKDTRTSGNQGTRLFMQWEKPCRDILLNPFCFVSYRYLKL